MTSRMIVPARLATAMDEAITRIMTAVWLAIFYFRFKVGSSWNVCMIQQQRNAIGGFVGILSSVSDINTVNDS